VGNQKWKSNASGKGEGRYPSLPVRDPPPRPVNRVNFSEIKNQKKSNRPVRPDAMMGKVGQAIPHG